MGVFDFLYPDQPDYEGAAAATGESGIRNTRNQTYANRANQYSPEGNITWDSYEDIDPSTGEKVTRWNQNTNLSPEKQKAYDDQQAIQGGRNALAANAIGGVTDELGNPMDYGKLPDRAGSLDVPDFYGEGLSDMGTAADGAYDPQFAQTQYDRQMSLEGPQMERALAQQETQLRNQGLRPGSQAYDTAMQDLRNQQGEQTSRMSQDALRTGADEQERQYGRDMQTAGYRDTQRSQQVDEQLAYGEQGFNQRKTANDYQNALRSGAISEDRGRRTQSLNEMNALQSGQQVGMPGQPTYNQAENAPATNYNMAAGNQGTASTSRGNTLIGAAGGLRN